MAALITAAFGLVSALAWNMAIQELFKAVFGEQSGLQPMLIYAFVVTIIAVVATLAIGRAAAIAVVKETKPEQEMEALRYEIQSLKEELRNLRKDSEVA